MTTIPTSLGPRPLQDSGLLGPNQDSSGKTGRVGHPGLAESRLLLRKLSFINAPVSLKTKAQEEGVSFAQGGE